MARLETKPNPKVYAVTLIAAILQKSHQEILTNKDLKISDIINSTNGNKGGKIPFEIWRELSLSVGVDLDAI
jgi:hypothetical protein